MILRDSHWFKGYDNSFQFRLDAEEKDVGGKLGYLGHLRCSGFSLN